VSKTVLLVDDSASFRTVIGLALKRAGYGLAEAVDGQDGLDKIAASTASAPIHAVVCDLNMPRLDGFGFVKALRASPAHRNTPVLMLTTETDPAKKAAGKALGVTAWLSKPFQPSNLVHALKTICP
jgi:two-component system chemotaxis response regulator CheY